MQKKLLHIGNILESALKSFRPTKDTEMTRIWELWHQALGETTARETKPAAFKENILIVHVSCSAWLQHLTFSKQELINKLNTALKSDLVKEIKFKIAKIHN